jgi:hypothetical protein
VLGSYLNQSQTFRRLSLAPSAGVPETSDISSSHGCSPKKTLWHAIFAKFQIVFYSWILHLGHRWYICSGFRWKFSRTPHPPSQARMLPSLSVLQDNGRPLICDIKFLSCDTPLEKLEQLSHPVSDVSTRLRLCNSVSALIYPVNTVRIRQVQEYVEARDISIRRDSSVSTATTLRAGCPRNMGSFPAKARVFLLSIMAPGPTQLPVIWEPWDGSVFNIYCKVHMYVTPNKWEDRA